MNGLSLATVLVAGTLTMKLALGAAEPSPTGLPFQNPALPLSDRVQDLIDRMSLDEKISQLNHEAPAIPRLGIRKYNWWNEGLHGALGDHSTAFPQSIGLAASWDTALLGEVGTAVSDEARAKYHQALRDGRDGLQFLGLTFWSPNINIFRDPRWGRGQETYGEDPYLTSRLAIPYIRGLQGDDPRYLKLVATPKHFAVHSGPESRRHFFDAWVSEHDLRETYLPAFEASIREGKAASVMCSYNSINGVPACADLDLLDTRLRKSWGFDGYVVSDCGAITNIFYGHFYEWGMPKAASAAIQAGTDLACGGEYSALGRAIDRNYLRPEDLNVPLRRLFSARFKLGMFDPDSSVPYASIPFSVVESPAHLALAHRAARESIVLLKNSPNALPIHHAPKHVAVIGPNANDTWALLGDYSATPTEVITPLAALQKRFTRAGTQVSYALGSEHKTDLHNIWNRKRLRQEATTLARRSDLAVLFVGWSAKFEGEEMDRRWIELPVAQEELVESVLDTGTPTILVLIGGSAIALPQNVVQRASAILEAWYPGARGGEAIADVLFGDTNPSGKLPVTFYTSTWDLPRYSNYSMKDRTYRYFHGKPLFPFGFGLSYTHYEYSNLRVPNDGIRRGQDLAFSVDVANTGGMGGDEVVEAYLSGPHGMTTGPIRSLKAFTRVHLDPKETRHVELTIPASALQTVLENGHLETLPGEYTLSVGGGQPDQARPEISTVSREFKILK